MGVKIFELMVSEEIKIKDLAGKQVIIDGNLFLYQFLSTIRQSDGSPLKDSQGNITSHLVGLFSRTVRLLQYKVKPIYVFDGISPDLKKKEQERRRNLKEEAKEKYLAALESKDIAEMKKYASRTSYLTKDMMLEAQSLIRALGIPIVLAPSEGEAQAAYLVKKGDAYAVATQDADSFLFAAPRIIKNLTISQKRKMPGSYNYSPIKPELFELHNILNHLGIDQSQLIALGMLVGTDFNIGGIPKIGPKNALKLVKKHGADLDSLFKEVKWSEHFDFPWTDVYYLFKNMPVTDDYTIRWDAPSLDAVKDILVAKHNFSEERIDISLAKLIKEEKGKEQSSLSNFF